MAAILYLVHSMPYPPNRGDKLRAYNILRYFSKNNDIYLGAFVDDPLDWPYTKKLQSYCVDTCFVEKPTKFSSISRILKAIITNKPITNQLYYSGILEQWALGVIKSGAVTHLFVNSYIMAPYLNNEAKDYLFKISDFVDFDSQKILQHGKRKGAIKNLLYKSEAKRLLKYEKNIASHCDLNLFVSNHEASMFKKTTKKDVKKPVVCLQNGVDTSYFNPYLCYVSPYQGENMRIVFTGRMDYFPNIEATIWFVKKVFPKILFLFKNVEFYIVGNNPTQDVFSLASNNGVYVTGSVPDIRPYLAYADVAVAPMKIASGIQNKILEAMAMNVSVIATQEAIVGFDAIEKALWIEKGVASWVSRCCYLLTEVQKQDVLKTCLARELAVNQYNWDSCLLPLQTAMDEMQLNV